MLPVLSQRLPDKVYSLIQMLRHTAHALRLLLHDRRLLSPPHLRQPQELLLPSHIRYLLEAVRYVHQEVRSLFPDSLRCILLSVIPLLYPVPESLSPLRLLSPAEPLHR